jgi:transporter family-2 protein
MTALETPPTTRAQKATGLAAALLCGAGVAAQARINGELGARLHDGLAAAVISFGSGFLILAFAAATVPSMRRGLRQVSAAVGKGELRWWQLLGGVCGALLVMSQGVTVATLGVAVFSVALVAGQSASSLAVDRLGVGPTGRHPLSANRVVGAALTVVAVLVAVADRLGHPATLALALLPAIAGVGTSWQAAVNGLVREYAGAALPPAFVNFAAGSAALVVAFAAEVMIRGWPTGSLPREPWLYLGGCIGVAFIAVAASVVRRTGVLLLSLGTIAGQVVTATLIDIALPGRHATPSAMTFLGVGLTLVAVVLAALPLDRHNLRKVVASGRG